MAWTVQYIGTADAIKRALSVYGKGLSGEDQKEFEVARPILEDLVLLSKDATVSLSLSASGNGETVSLILMKSNALHVQ